MEERQANGIPKEEKIFKSGHLASDIVFTDGGVKFREELFSDDYDGERRIGSKTLTSFHPNGKPFKQQIKHGGRPFKNSEWNAQGKLVFEELFDESGTEIAVKRY